MSGVKGRSGRRSKDRNTKETQQNLTESAKLGAQYIKDVIDHKVKRPSALRLKACEFAINHAIGTASQKIKVHQSGSILTMADMVKLANNWDKSGNGSNGDDKNTDHFKADSLSTYSIPTSE